MSEDRPPGTRKPYRISKPREKWTEAEHERFVSAINQHGRNWRKIVLEVGTRTVAQVRSHAQKYFLKLEKNGNTEEVPPARAKRPSTKPYPVKGGSAEPSNRSSQSIQAAESKRPRRTERLVTKPLRTDFTLTEESPAISTDCDSIAFLLSEEGNGSNNNNNASTQPANTTGHKSGSNGTGTSMSQRQSSALSTAELDPTACFADETVPSPDSNMFREAPFGEREHSDPTDASSGAVPGMEDAHPPNYGEFYNAVGKVFTNHQGSNQQCVQQLGATQRSELVHMLDRLTGELRDGFASINPTPCTLSTPAQPLAGVPVGYGPPTLPAISTVAGMGHASPCLQETPRSLTEGGSNSNFTTTEPGQDLGSAQCRAPSDELLPMDSGPTGSTELLPGPAGGSELLPPLGSGTDVDNADWGLGVSDDLGALLAAPVLDYCPYPPSQLIDSKVFDY